VRILLVEDDQGLARMLERGLSSHGHQVLTAEDGEAGALLASDPTVELVLLDIALPRLSGQEVLSRIRARRRELPVLMLTARDDVNSKVGALDAGADDYLVKPFAFEELLARIRALTRRADQRRSSHIEVGDLRLDLLARRVWRGEQHIDLSSREFALLEYFMRHLGQVLSREQILSAVWRFDFDPKSNVIDVYVRYLRRKLDLPGQPSLITAVRGAGYRFEPPRA
jgi:DNA-binding response OmpR family regulator